MADSHQYLVISGFERSKYRLGAIPPKLRPGETESCVHKSSEYAFPPWGSGCGFSQPNISSDDHDINRILPGIVKSSIWMSYYGMERTRIFTSVDTNSTGSFPAVMPNRNRLTSRLTKCRLAEIEYKEKERVKHTNRKMKSTSKDTGHQDFLPKIHSKSHDAVRKVEVGPQLVISLPQLEAKKTPKETLSKFSLSKHQALVKFSKPPEPHPNTVCFDYPGTDLTHAEVKALIDNKLLFEASDGKIVSIQFKPMSVIYSSSALNNRWIVTMDSTEAAGHLVYNGLVLKDDFIFVHYYDDVLKEEYDKYLKFKMITNGELPSSYSMKVGKMSVYFSSTQ